MPTRTRRAATRTCCAACCRSRSCWSTSRSATRCTGSNRCASSTTSPTSSLRWATASTRSPGASWFDCRAAETAMTIKDSLGHALSGASAQSLDHFELACHQLRCYIGDPLAQAQQALAASPGMTMGHLLVAYLNLLGTEPAGLPLARDALATALTLPADEREQAHRRAVEHLVAGRWHAAGAVLE